MNSKKVNWIFFFIILISTLVSVGLAIAGDRISISIVTNLILSELILIVPALVFVFASKTKLSEVFLFRKIKISSVFMIILFVYLTMPLVSLVNACTMLFSSNVVTEISGDVLGWPFLLMILLMGVYGPVCEELVFRGIIYSGYKKSTNAFYAMIFSALLFGMMHQNFNQAPYAFVIGFSLVFLKEATNSLWAPIIYHVVFNSHSVILLYVSNRLFPELMETANMDMTRESLLITISFLIIIAAITSALAICVLIWIAGNENRKSNIAAVWKERKEGKGNIFSLPLIISIIICFASMIWSLF